VEKPENELRKLIQELEERNTQIQKPPIQDPQQLALSLDLPVEIIIEYLKAQADPTGYLNAQITLEVAKRMFGGGSHESRSAIFQPKR